MLLNGRCSVIAHDAEVGDEANDVDDDALGLLLSTGHQEVMATV